MDQGKRRNRKVGCLVLLPQLVLFNLYDGGGLNNLGGSKDTLDDYNGSFLEWAHFCLILLSQTIIK